MIWENRTDMDKVVAYLLEKETITGAEMVAILEGRDPATADQYPTESAEPKSRREELHKPADTPIPLGGEITPEGKRPSSEDQ